MDWGSIVRVSEYLGAILIIGGVIVSVFVNLRKIVHVYDKMEELIINYDKTNENIDNMKTELKQELQQQIKLAEQRKELLLGVARQILLERFNAVLEAKEITTAEFTTLSTLYEAYTLNGGNSVIHDMWKQVRKLPIKNN